MAPLSEVHNQARPPRRPAVYGRRRGVLPETREIHRQLFGTDENDITDGFQKLTINAESDGLPQVPALECLESETKAAPKQKSPTRPEAAAKPTSKQKTAGRKQKQLGRGTRRGEMAPITDTERELLEPLLSCEHVHSEVKSFRAHLRDILSQCAVQKLGEGSYSSTFLLESPEDKSVIKVLQFHLSCNGQALDPGKHETSTDQNALIREIQVLNALSDLPGFTRARGTCQIVRGKYPRVLADAFSKFQLTEPDKAFNEAPSEEDDELFYAIIEMSHAGTDLDDIKLPSSFAVFDVFWMAAIYLASAERRFEFEHRDLHMSNLCFTSRNTAKSQDSGNSSIVLGHSGLEITIIDYTLSRMQLQDVTVWHPDGAGAGSLAKPPKTEYQSMAVWRVRQWCEKEYSRLLAAGEKPVDKWEPFLPKTNVIGLGFLLGELSRRGFEVKDAGTDAEETLQREIWRRLRAVHGVLDTEDLSKLPASAEELLEMGVNKGWVAEGDIRAFSERLNSENE